MQRTGIPAAITLAQGIHETEAGTSDLVRKSNNHFGIKCKDNWSGPTVSHNDDARGECFRKYDAPEESYKDHSDFLKYRANYASLFTLDPTDYEAWANGLNAWVTENAKNLPVEFKLTGIKPEPWTAKTLTLRWAEIGLDSAGNSPAQELRLAMQVAKMGVVAANKAAVESCEYLT